VSSTIARGGSASAIDFEVEAFRSQEVALGSYHDDTRISYK
jgi:hypothetical protein